MNISYLNKYLMLRLLVGYLGEKNQFGWWKTAFYEPSSKLFLDPVFPKTTLLAQYHGVKEAARHHHDEYIGIGNVFHLFRLPEEIEQDLHRLLSEKKSDDQIFQELTSKETAIQALTHIANGVRDLTEGPIAIGKFDSLFTPRALKEIAQTYLAAFGQGTKSYPYFTG